MDPPERQAQSPTLGVRVDGDIAGSRNQGALVPGTAATEGGASPARESFAASGASPSREAMTSFGVGQSKGPLSDGGDAAGDDMTDMADTAGLEWKAGRGGGGGGREKQKGGGQRQGTSKISRDRPLPELKQASPPLSMSKTGSGASSQPTSRLQTPKVNRTSPSGTRSRQSSISSSPKSPPTGLAASLALRTSPVGSLSESFDVGATGERTGPGQQRRVSTTDSTAGINFRAVGSPGSSNTSFSRAGQGERRKSAPDGGRGRGASSRSPPSHGGSSRTKSPTSPSPDAKRSSMSFVDYVAASNSELSLLESSRVSTGGGKRTRDRNALRVAVRIRPLISREKGSRTVTGDGGSGRMIVVNPKKFKASADAVIATASAVSRANMATSDWLRPFDFDRVFWSAPSEPNTGNGEDGSANGFSTQQSVYEGLGERIVEDVLNGINCSCFAYGHTGSGKTYSMFGCGGEAALQEGAEGLAAPPEGDAFGLVPRVCFHLLRRLHEAGEGAPPSDPGTSSVGLSVQFIEIYNDKIRDLLHPGADSSAFRVREHPNTGPYVDNLVPVQVESWSQLRQLLVLGCSARTEADTPENSKSSRGHAILTLEVGTPAGLSRVQMVDLAGSEREVSTRDRVGDDRGGHERGGSGGGDVGGRPLPQRLRETAQIKKALSNLGIIIKGLSKGRTPVGLPFRDSVLTWLLKEALSGRAHTTMLATISPSSNNYVETMNTLKYAERLRRASAHLNKDANGPPIGKPSDCMKEEMENLVKKLGADGVEAKRQVLYQTVSDPQQRIAKLTAKDPRRRRTSSGGSSIPLGGPRQDIGLGPGPRRTSFPGTGPATPQRFGWNPSPATPTRHIGDKPRSNSERAIIDSAKFWGSPIVNQDSLSAEEGAGAGVGSGVGVGTETTDISSKHGVGVSSGITSAVSGTESSRITYQLGGARGGGMLSEDSDQKLYSSESSENEEDGGGDGEDGAGRDGRYGDGGYGGSGGDSVLDQFDDAADDDTGEVGDDVGEDVKDYVEEDVEDYDDGVHVHAGVTPTASATRKGGNRQSEARENLQKHAEEVEQGRNAAMSIATAVRREGDDDDVRTASTGEEQSHSWPTSPEGGTAPDWAGTSSSETSRSPGSERDLIAAGNGGGTESSNASGVGNAAVVAPRGEGLANALGSRPSDALDPSDTASTGSEGLGWLEVSDSALQTRRADDARGSRVPSKHITWAEEQGNSQDDSGGGGEDWRAYEEESAGRAGYRSGAMGVGAGHGDLHRAEGHSPVRSQANEERGQLDRAHSPRSGDPRRDEQYGQLGRADSPRFEGFVNSSVDSGGEGGDLAAALAASGVFDTTGTSADTEGNGEDASMGDVDSLEGTGAQGGAWASQRQQLQRRRREREDQQRNALDDGEDVSDRASGRARGGGDNDDVRRIIEDLMRQIEKLKGDNTALREEVQRLREELRRSKNSEEEAWAIGDDTSQEFRSRLASIQRQLDDQTSRARDAERSAREADERAESAAAAPSDANLMIDEARRRTKEAEQRAREAEAREDKLQARARDAAARLEASEIALEEQTAVAEEAKADAKQSRATLEAAGGGVDVGVGGDTTGIAEAHRASEKERLKAVDAEARASRAVAKAKELSALIEEQDERLGRGRKDFLAEEARADGAEVRERRAEARVEELIGQMNENEKRLSRVREALEAEETRADEAAAGRDAAERRVRDLERDMDRRQSELEKAKNEAEASIAATLEAGGAEMKTLAARTNAVILERDRGLEQIEAERTEVLRLSAALTSLRTSSRQDLKAAQDREAALKAVLASESEASRSEQAELEQLLSLIASAQGTEGGGGGDSGADQPPPVSVSGARFAIEAQRAKHEAARRRLQALEDENRALRRSKADHNASLDKLRSMEEERDFLLQEKDALDERLQNLEVRQQAFQEREKNAGHQDAPDGFVREKLEEELRGLERQLAEEVDLRAKEAAEFADRLKEKDEQAAEQLSNTLKQVMDGVKSQAGHIRGTISNLEGQRDEAISERDAARSQLQDMACQLETMQREKEDVANEVDSQMQQSARERAALWLAVNKLDVLEAAKDAAIKDLQMDGENKSRDLKVLQATNAGLTRELGQVDMSLMQALEDNGLTLDSVRLNNTPTARRVTRRRLASNGRSSITNGHATGNPPPHPNPRGARDPTSPNPKVDDHGQNPSPNQVADRHGHGRVPSRARSLRSSAIAGAFAVDDVPSSQRQPQGGTVVEGRRESTRRHQRFQGPGAVPDKVNSDYGLNSDSREEGEEEEGEVGGRGRNPRTGVREEEVVARRRRAQTGRRNSEGRQGNANGGQEFEGGAAFDNRHTARGMGERRRTYNGSASSSLHADSWDPAINTIEREIEQLSERLSGQPRHTGQSHHTNSTSHHTEQSHHPAQQRHTGQQHHAGQPHHTNSNTSRMRRASSQDDDLVGEGSYGREQGPVAKGMGVTSGTDGKRIRVRSSVVSPPKKTPPQVRKRERGGLI